MQALIGLLQNVGVFLAFLAARFAVLLVVLAALTVVFLAGLAVVRLAGRVRRHALGLTKVGGLVWRPGRLLLARPLVAAVEGRRAGARRPRRPGAARAGARQRGHAARDRPGAAGRRDGRHRCGPDAGSLSSRRRSSGTVVAINRRLLRNPSLIHNDPYAHGWLYAVAPDGRRRTRGCPTASRRASGSRGEAHRLLAVHRAPAGTWPRPTAASSSRQDRRCSPRSSGRR